MDVKPKIYALGNMGRKGELMEKEPSKAKSGLISDQPPKKLFYREASKFDVKKLFDKMRGIKKAPDSVKSSLENLSKNYQSLSNLKNILDKNDNNSGWVKTTYNSGSEKPGSYEKVESPIIFSTKLMSESAVETKYNISITNTTQENLPITKDDTSSLHPTDVIGTPPATDIDLDKIQQELESLDVPPKDSQSDITKQTQNKNPIELAATAKDTKLESLKDKFGAPPTKINIKPSTAKVNPELAKREANARELYSVLKDLGLRDNGAISKIKPRDKNNSGTVNNLKNSPTITTQNHIDNLKKLINLDQIKHHENYLNNHELQRQVEDIETTITILASVSMQKKSESPTKGIGSLESWKRELKIEYNKLLHLATKNKIEIPDEMSKSIILNRSIDSIKHIDFIPKKKI